MKEEKNSQLVRNTLILSIGQFMPRIFSLLTLPIITTFLSKAENGTYDLANTLVSVLIPVLTLQIQQGAFRFLITAQDKNEKDSYITCSVVYIVVSSLVFYPLVVLSLYLMGTDILSCILICTMLFSESLFKLFGQVVRGLGHNFHYSISVVVYAFFNLVFILLFVVFIKMSFYGAMLSLSSGYMIAIVYMFLVTKMYKYIKPKCMTKQKMKELLKYSAPIVPSSISLWICQLSDRLIVTQYLGAGANGIYSVANKIPNMYSFAYNTFNLAWTETAVRTASEDRAKYYSDMFDKLLMFLTGFLLILMTFTPIIFKLLVNSAYDEAYLQIPVLYLGIFASSFVSFFGGIYIALKRTKQVGYSSFAGAVLNLVINLIFVKQIGLFAASISTVLSYVVILLFRIFDLNKVIKLKYSIRRIIIALSVVAVTVCLCWVRSFWSMGVSLIIAAIFNYIFNKQLIASLTKKLLGIFIKRKKA